MLRALRNQTQSIFFKCFLVLLVCGFALWGVGDLTGGSKGKNILSVQNQSISVEEVLNEINRSRYFLPERPSLEEAIKNGMHKSILNKFEQEILINEEANHLELYVPLTEQMKYIRKEKAFKDPLGKFSESKFNQSLNNAGLKESKYLEMVKTNSNFKQLSMPFIFNNHYNKSVIKRIIEWQNEIKDVEYEKFKLINRKNIEKPSNNTLKTFYKKNQKLYEVPLTRDIKYIEIYPYLFEDQVEINQNKIDQKYEIEKSNYKTEETREILQITTQDEDKAKKFLDLIKSGKNFNEMAKINFNLTISDTNIGVLKKSDLPLESSEIVFNAKLNETLGPIKTKFGFNIYKIIKITPAKQINYQEAIIDIKKKLVKELSIEILFEKLDQIEDLIAEGNNIDEIAKSSIFNKDIPIISVKKISRQGLIYSNERETSYLKKNSEFIKNIWNTKIDQLSEIFNSHDDNYFLIEIINENNKNIPKFNSIKSKIYNDWLDEELIIKSKEKVNKLVANKNNELLLKTSVKRSDNNLDEIKDQLLVNKIFEINNNKVNLLVSGDNLLAVKIKKTKISDYKLDKKIYEELNLNFSKSFFNDFSNFYIQHLASKHKLKRNFQELDNYFPK